MTPEILQAQVRSSSKQLEMVEPEVEEVASVQTESELEMPKVWDYEQLREDYGW